MNISLAHPKYGFERQKQALLDAAERVLEGGWYILGEECASFEREFAAYCGLAHAIGVGSGTDALEIALRAAGVQPGAAVATVSHTAVATVAAIERIGAIPILVDIDASTYTMSPSSLEKTLNAVAAGRHGMPKALAAIVPVQLYGQCADMDAILAIAGDIPVIEDCAQAHGALYKGQKAGCMGLAGSFSFYPTKNLGAFGDGGAVCTNDPAIAEQARLLRQYGWKTRYESSIRGVNSRLDELQAALLRVRLQKLEEENGRRRRLAAVYAENLRDVEGILTPQTREGCVHVYHLYVVRVENTRSKNRDALANCLKTQGIGTGVHYPLPVHLQHAYKDNIAAAPDGLPATEAVSRELLSLPMHPGLSEQDVQRVCDAIHAFWR